VELSREECLDLLAVGGVGRLAVNVGGSAPAIRPINYLFDERSQSIVFRSDYGSKLFGLITSRKAAFEVDAIHSATRSGWSVIVIGVAEEIRDPFELRRLARAGLEPWAAGPKAHWLRIRTQLVTGRRIEAEAPRAAADQ
jgi:nitroimidazol reductase NimA-like FMN-containing flavoprotein (pyridoxamine 5'-phosphate oxidase superfamily)